MPQIFNILDQAVLTNLINRPVETALESAPFLGEQIAPLEDIESRYVRLRINNQYALGIGQPKAPNAMPALVDMPVGEFTEQEMELLDLEEMHRINSSQWQQLVSGDENIRNSQGLDIVERGQVLQRRNERITEAYRWNAFSGLLTVVFPRTGATLSIDYQFPTGHSPTPTHLWTDLVNSDPVADMDAWQTLLANDSGHVGINVHMTSQTAKNMLRNQNLKTYFNIPSGQPFKPTLEDVAGLLADGTRFILYDAGWRPMQSGAPYVRTDIYHNRYLPHNRVLMTTEYEVEGDRIADTPNGQVEISQSYDEAAPQLGPASEIILDHMTKNRYLRQASSRVPRILHPECFLYATVG